MSECKHEWRDNDADAKTYTCKKCKMQANSWFVVADTQSQLAAKERQLEAAAEDMVYYADCGKCPLPGPGCDRKACMDGWRRRWEE